MRKKIAGCLALCGALCAQAATPPSYTLVWEDDFQGTAYDERYWSKVPRGPSDWNDVMSPDDSLYEVKDGVLVLHGRENKGLVPDDPAPFLTGGLFTKGKVDLLWGKVEVRARLHGARGAWPAIWLHSYAPSWPNGGEIDIVERLNFDAFAYQTVHTPYTQWLRMKEPPSGGKGAIDPDGYNVYSAEKLPDRIVLRINGEPTLVYPRIETDKKGQFPFGEPHYLILSMQLGGKWVGEVDPADLPTRMEVDWVRFYKLDDGKEGTAPSSPPAGRPRGEVSGPASSRP